MHLTSRSRHRSIAALSFTFRYQRKIRLTLEIDNCILRKTRGTYLIPGGAFVPARIDREAAKFKIKSLSMGHCWSFRNSMKRNKPSHRYPLTSPLIRPFSDHENCFPRYSCSALIGAHHFHYTGSDLTTGSIERSNFKKA